jgi:hypothetical protein
MATEFSDQDGERIGITFSGGVDRGRVLEICVDYMIWDEQDYVVDEFGNSYNPHELEAACDQVWVKQRIK